MKILLYGNKGVGKTTFWVSVCGMTWQAGGRGRVRCLNPQAQQRLTAAWEALTNRMSYPPSNEKLTEEFYEFCQTGDNGERQTFIFQCTDIPGELISRPDGRDPELIRLKIRLRQANVIVLFLDAPSIFAEDFCEEQMYDMFAYLYQYGDAEGKQLMILPLVSRFDLAAAAGLPCSWKEQIDALLWPLEKMAEGNPNIILEPRCISAGIANYDRQQEAFERLMAYGLFLSEEERRKKKDKKADTGRSVGQRTLLDRLFHGGRKENTGGRTIQKP